jgi:hypothetical protein
MVRNKVDLPTHLLQLRLSISFVLNLDLDLGNSSNRIFGFVTNA